MLSKPEVVANQKDLFELAREKGDELQERIRSVDDVHLAMKLAEEVASDYYVGAHQQILGGLEEVGTNAAEHYVRELNLNLSPEEVNGLVRKLIDSNRNEEYYGATLDQRMDYNYRRLRVSLKQASTVYRKTELRAQSMGNVFVERGPFGNHVSKDNRVLLSESTRLEHQIARELAQRAGLRYVKWTVSDTHKVEDICDELVGVYPIEACPLPPHPNCQCTLQILLSDEEATTTITQRSIDAIRNLIKRLRPRRKGQ